MWTVTTNDGGGQPVGRELVVGAGWTGWRFSLEFVKDLCKCFPQIRPSLSESAVY